jgi:hypothetical protein
MAANSSFVLVSKSLVRVSTVYGSWAVSGWRVLLRFLLVLCVPPPEVRGNHVSFMRCVVIDEGRGCCA